MRYQHGFNLLELLVAVTIVAIMTSIAIPNYNNYITRAKITEIFTLVTPLKLELTEALVMGENPVIKELKDISSYISSIKIVDANNISITANHLALGLDSELVLVFTAKKSAYNFINWSCSSTKKYHKLVPQICRQ